jgi:hypothetical protein
MKYEHIRRWVQRYDDWLKKNNHEPSEHITRRWLRDEIDELRECIEEILFPRGEIQSPTWIGLTEDDLERLTDDVQWQHLWDHDLAGTPGHLQDFAEAVESYVRTKNESR